MKRHGFTFVEIFAAIAVIAVCAVLFVQLVTLTASERVNERTRQQAVDQIQNALERLAILPPERLIAGDFDKNAAESLIERTLPEGRIVFDTKEAEHDNIIFTVAVSWCNGKGKPRREVAMFRLLTPE